MKTIYIAGKVTGEEPIECARKFQQMEDILIEKGFNPINPIKLVDNPNSSWDAAMAICLTHLKKATAIYMMPCSIHSKGALIELDRAIQLNLYIYSAISDL